VTLTVPCARKAHMLAWQALRGAMVGVNYLGRSASIILAGEAKCC